MAKLSEEVFRASGLNRWGSDGYTPPKPPSTRAISHLATSLDQAERAESIAFDEPISCEVYGCLSDRRHMAEARYVRAINQRDSAERFKAQNRKRLVRAADAFVLKDKMYQAGARHDRLESLGKNFSTVRERIDAQAAAHHTADLYDIAQTKFQDDQREAIADKLAGIIRHRGSPRIHRHSLRG
jgi:hypothetical protein